jgi:probable HAF family extracellular repeat protein
VEALEDTKMKTNNLTTCMIALFLAAAATEPVRLSGQALPGGTQTHYVVVPLSTLGSDLSFASGINNNGWVVGDSSLPGDQNEHATLWVNGVITDLGTLGGPNSSIGFIGADPNDTGLITGNAQTSSVDPLGEYWGVNYGCTASGTTCEGWQYLTRGFSWKDGVITALPTLGGNNTLALGRANQRGQIVGISETATPDPNCIAPQVLDWVPVIWEPNGKIQRLAFFPGDAVGGTTAINDEGQVVGGTGLCSLATPGTTAITHALLWENGKVTNLGSLGGAFNNVAVSINNRGQVVGLSDLPGDTTSHAFLWQNRPGHSARRCLQSCQRNQQPRSGCRAVVRREL